jgi:hypothetical protein
VSNLPLRSYKRATAYEADQSAGFDEHALGAMVAAGLLTLVFMSAVDVRSMVWPLLIYAFVTT